MRWRVIFERASREVGHLGPFASEAAAEEQAKAVRRSAARGVSVSVAPATAPAGRQERNPNQKATRYRGHAIRQAGPGRYIVEPYGWRSPTLAEAKTRLDEHAVIAKLDPEELFAQTKAAREAFPVGTTFPWGEVVGHEGAVVLVLDHAEQDKPGARASRHLFGAGLPRTNPASEVQSLLFTRDQWTPSEAKGWAKKHGYKVPDIEVTESYVRIRQAPPRTFTRLRTVPFEQGIKAIVGWRAP